MQLSFIEPVKEETNSVPAIRSLYPGQAFRRKGDRHKGYIYMLVSISPAMRCVIKDDRDCVILNLKTGTIFPAYSREEIDPLPHAAVIEDQVKQLKRGR